MGKIIAIGGGEIGRPKEDGGFYPIETTAIDREILNLTEKENPRLLFIPTASNDSKGYCEVIEKHFGGLGCKVDYLFLSERPTRKEIENIVFSCDVIYVGGGNTKMMMAEWKEHRLNDILKEAYEKGIVLSGLSAGSICWFSFGESDSLIMTGKSDDYVLVEGLGWIDAINCPHFDERENKNLKAMIEKTGKPAIALENCSALEIVNDKYRVIKSKENARAYKITIKNNELYLQELKEEKEYKSLFSLLNN